MKLTFTEIKNFCNDLASLDVYNWREVLENILSDSPDFEVENYRFIHADSIDQILVEELSADEYTLGCFNAWFIADVLGIDQDVITAMQESDRCEAIGKLIISLDKVEELASEYVRYDGYGHHFNSYDGGEELITLGGREYYAFGGTRR